jgi:hypothetical protein
MINKLRICGLLVVIIVAVASTVYALPMNAHDITYYSDSTFETAVGGRYVGCAGASSSWGTITGFYDSIFWSCASGETVACSETICAGYYSVDQYGQPVWEPGACTTTSCNDW